MNSSWTGFTLTCQYLFMGEQATQVMSAGPFLQAFLVLIVLPLGFALVTEFGAKRNRKATAWLKTTARLPVPLMALTLILVVASQMGRIEEFLPMVSQAVPIYLGFMLIMPLLARLIGHAFSLDAPAGRALIFSAGTRNSLVVLPLALALALPEAWILTSAVIVTQTVVELVGELFYIRMVPALIFREAKR